MNVAPSDMHGLSMARVGPLWPWIPPVALGARLVHHRLRRPGTTGVGGADAFAAALLSYSALAHVVEIPPHWAEGPALGLFFVVASAVLVGQATSVATGPTRLAYRTVVITTAVLLGLYVLARQVTLPVVQHRDPYQPAELAVKAAEALALAVAVLQTRAGLV